MPCVGKFRYGRRCLHSPVVTSPEGKGFCEYHAPCAHGVMLNAYCGKCAALEVA